LNKSKGDGWPGVVCRFNHNDEFLLGSTAGGTLQLNVDNRGLIYRVELPQCREDILESVTRGDIASSSFAFQCYEDEWRTGSSGYPQRVLLSVRLIDVAPVVTPAYPDATVGLRSLAAHMDAPIEDVQELARADELRRFFTRSDAPSQQSGRKPGPLLKLLALHATKFPEQPKSGREALIEIVGKRWLLVDSSGSVEPQLFDPTP
jgi:HK97 family phage prohead protease